MFEFPLVRQNISKKITVKSKIKSVLHQTTVINAGTTNANDIRSGLNRIRSK